MNFLHPALAVGHVLTAAAETSPDPWPQFWLTVVATLAGALFGAVAAWGFALDLRRRQERADYADRLNAAIADISSAVRSVTRTGRSSIIKRLFMNAEHRIVVDEDKVLTAIERARMIANKEDDTVLLALRRRIQEHFKFLRMKGRVALLLQALHQRGVPVNSLREWNALGSADRKRLAGIDDTRSVLRFAHDVWHSWQNDPLRSLRTVRSWRRGEVTTDQACVLLDLQKTPMLTFEQLPRERRERHES